MNDSKEKFMTLEWKKQRERERQEFLEDLDKAYSRKFPPPPKFVLATNNQQVYEQYLRLRRRSEPIQY